MPGAPFTGAILTPRPAFISGGASSPQNAQQALPSPKHHTRSDSKQLNYLPPRPPTSPTAASTSPRVATPPQTSTPSTPLRQRFLHRVEGRPVTPTPPLTPRSECASRSGSPTKQVLELGANAFYFACEVPRRGSPTPKKEKKMESPRKSEKEASGGVARPRSPEKLEKGGKVKDILRRNLFGAPANVASPAKVHGRVSPVRDGVRGSGFLKKVGKPAEGKASVQEKKESGEEKCEDAATVVASPDAREMVPEVPVTADAPTSSSSESPDQQLSSRDEPLSPEVAPARDLSSPLLPSTAKTAISSPELPPQQINKESAPAETRETHAESTTDNPPELVSLPPQNAIKTPSTTRSDIGELMASFKTGPPSAHKPADVSGVEGMPTPLRKASERLFAGDSRPVQAEWKSRSSQQQDEPKRVDGDVPTKLKRSGLLDPARCVTPEQTALKTRSEKSPVTPASGSRRPQSMVLNRVPWAQQSIGGTPSEYSRSSAARTMSPGTPDRLRSSIQREMEQMREALQKSLGSETGSERTSAIDASVTSNEVEAPTVITEASSEAIGGKEEDQKDVQKANSVPPTSKTAGRPQSALGTLAATKPTTSEPPKRTVKSAQSAQAAPKARPRSMFLAPAPSMGTVKGPRPPPSEKPADKKPPAASRPRSMVFFPPPAQKEVVVRTTKASALRQKAAQAATLKTAQPNNRTTATKETDEKPTKAPPPRQRAQPTPTPRVLPRKPITPTAPSAPPVRKAPSTVAPSAPKSPSKPHIVSRKPVPPPHGTLGLPKRGTAPSTLGPTHPQRPRVVSAEDIADQIGKWSNEERARAVSPPPAPRPTTQQQTQPRKAPVTPQKRPSSPRKRSDFRDGRDGERVDQEDSEEEESHTPVGLPTKLRSPTKTPALGRAPITPAAKAAGGAGVNPLRAPKTPNFGAARGAGGGGGNVGAVGGTAGGSSGGGLDPNALRTPSKEIQSALDRAIDAKIAEDARSGREYTPSGNRISELLARRRG